LLYNLYRMKNIYRLLSVLTMLGVILGLCSCNSKDVDSKVGAVEYTELGIPNSQRYQTGIAARCPWEITVWDGKLFIGAGDYDKNAGPVDIWYYDLQEGVWVNSGEVPDEEVNRFTVIDGCLVAPGIDPKENGSLGNFYRFENDAWTTVKSIPGGLHCFDMIEYDGKIFSGIGVESGQYPIAVSTDKGNSFSYVEMYKNNALIDTSGSKNVRVYDLFVFNDTLYGAFLFGDTDITYDLYRYENGVFVFDNQWYNKIHQVNYNNYIIGGKAEYKGNMYFTTGYLYATDDMANFTRVAFPRKQTVYDICVDENGLNALCAEKLSDGKYEISVWKNSSEKLTEFDELFSFIYDIPALSIACANGDFYIGMGERGSVNDKNGMILYIDFTAQKDN